MSMRATFLSIFSLSILVVCTGAVAPAAAQGEVKKQGEMSGDKTVMVGGAPMYPSKNIVENAVNSKDHTTLVAAVKAAGLVQTLASRGPFTVFAPTNAAFAKLPTGTLSTLVKPENRAELTKILAYHIVAGKFLAADLTDGKKLRTVEGEELTVKILGGQIILVDPNGGVSEIIVQDVNQSNGIVHVVDSVLRPRLHIASNDKNISFPSNTKIGKLEDFFPWPPIKPTGIFHYPDRWFLSQKKSISLKDFSNHLDEKLNSRGYTEKFYFSQTSGNGFVVVTRMERIDDDGKSAKDERWTSDVKLKRFSLLDLMEAIVGQRLGRFRSFALVVTRDSRAASQKRMTFDQLEDWLSQGQASLPKGYENVALTPAYDIYALVYEFARTIDSEKPFFVEKSSLSAVDHLRGAGLSAGDLK